jgi:hypothetical protein
MIDIEQGAQKQPVSAYATLPILTTKDRCVALALATTSLTTSALLLGTWMCSRTIPYSNGFSFSRIYEDLAASLRLFNFVMTVLCILASYLCQGRRWRVLFAFCAVLGIAYFCMTACPVQLARE